MKCKTCKTKGCQCNKVKTGDLVILEYSTYYVLAIIKRIDSWKKENFINKGHLSLISNTKKIIQPRNHEIKYGNFQHHWSYENCKILKHNATKEDLEEAYPKYFTIHRVL